MKSEIDRLRTEFESKLKSCTVFFRIKLCATQRSCRSLTVVAAESDRLAADARVQQAEARAADLEKFIDKERLLHSDKVRALEATIGQQKSEIQDARRSHDQQVKQFSHVI